MFGGGDRSLMDREMSVPSPLVTKLRLLYQRANHAFEVAKEQKETAWMAYVKQMRVEGFCPGCEKPLEECKCVLMAASGGYDIPPGGLISRVGEYTSDCVVPRAIADIIRGRVPESGGSVSASITSTETAESPARQSGSPEVDPSGERQCPDGTVSETFAMYRMGPDEWD